MRNVKLYIATSLDGFIAKEDKSLDWLFTDQDYGYKAFYDSIDTIVVGHTTFKEMLELDKNAPDEKKKFFVFSHKEHESDWKNVEYIRYDIPEFVEKIKDLPGKDIWLMGGGQINALLMNAGLIDQMIVAIHPVVLGEGTKLFDGKVEMPSFQLQQTSAFESGLVQVSYIKV